ncbi:hypothetical protein BGZ83_006530 [Gryganskiella cystojenkinii]|nr:hypothetical protein BGZ83_006530 [Gryganskiella cystojenkinii]
MSNPSVEIYRSMVTDLIYKADIPTVSAKGIRKQVEQLTNSSLAHIKREFDELVIEIYTKITDEIERAVLNGNAPPQHQQQHFNNHHNHYQQPQQHHHQQQHHQQQHHQQQNYYQQTSAAPQVATSTAPSSAPPGIGFALPPTSYVPPKIEVKKEEKPRPAAPAKSSSSTSSKKKVKKEVDSGDESDASFSSVEGESTSRKKARTSSSPAAKKKPSKKSSKADKADKPKRKQPMNPDGTPKTNAFTRPLIISSNLANVIGDAGTIGASGQIEMSRPEVVKQMWVYIKANNLQNEQDKRTINCDAKLKNLFGLDQVNCFSMNKYLSAHLTKPEEAPSAQAI